MRTERVRAGPLGKRSETKPKPKPVSTNIMGKTGKKK